MKHYVFSKNEIDYYRMNHKCNAEKMFTKEGIGFREYYEYLIFQVQKSFRIVGTYFNYKSEVKSQIDTNLEKKIMLELQSQKSEGFSRISLNLGAKSVSKGPISSLNSSKMNTTGNSEWSVGSQSRAKIRFSRRSQDIRKSKEKVSIWNKLVRSLSISARKDYEDYEVIPNLRFLRLNNLVFELTYYENRGTGKIGEIRDAFGFQKEGPLQPEVFIKKLDMFEKNYFEILFEKNEERHKSQFSILLQKSKNHLDEYKMGVFYCEEKICDLCGKKNSPFDFVSPVEIKVKKEEHFIDPSTEEDCWMRDILNVQAKNTFILPCEFFGKDFKESYINYRQSRKSKLTGEINGIHMLCYREFLRSRAVRRLDDFISCFDQNKLKCLFCRHRINEKIHFVWVDKLLLNYDR